MTRTIKGSILVRQKKKKKKKKKTSANNACRYYYNHSRPLHSSLDGHHIQHAETNHSLPSLRLNPHLHPPASTPAHPPPSSSILNPLNPTPPSLPQHSPQSIKTHSSLLPRRTSRNPPCIRPLPLPDLLLPPILRTLPSPSTQPAIN